MYSLKVNPHDLEKRSGKIVPTLLGINRASTFTGFCSLHDDQLFAPVEKVPFTGRPEQCLLLAYRAVSREVFTKRGQCRLFPTFRDLDRGRSKAEQVALQAYLHEYDRHLQAGLRDIERTRTQMGAVITGRDYSSVRGYLIELDAPPPVMCSAGFDPEEDVFGNELQDLTKPETVGQVLTISSFSSNGTYWVAFAWTSQVGIASEKLVESLESLADERLPSTLVRLMFEYCENVHMAPTWWEDLDSNLRSYLMRRIMSGISAPRPHGHLKDDGVTFPFPKPVSRRRVGW